MYQTQSTEKNDTSQVASPATLNAHALSTLFEIITVVHRWRRLNDTNLLYIRLSFVDTRLIQTERKS